METAAEDTAAEAAVLRFGALDYSSFGAMMVASALVGVYYGFFKKQESLAEYFLGGRTMGVFPIAMSLIASNISGVTMLAVPADIYAFGSQISIVTFVGVPVVLLVIHCFLPTFYKLQYESSYEYLEHRFDKKIRTISSVFFTIGAYLYMPIVMYVPCLAFHQVSGVSVHLINPITCLVCVFYTCVGGFRAVVWTDALQLVSLVLASCTVLALCVARMGFGEIWERNAQGGRLELFNMDPDPTIRTSFWSVVIGESMYFINTLGVSPSSVQRYLALPTIGAAKRAAWTLALGFTITRALSCATGSLMYAYYYDCDPIATKVVPGRDNLLPHFIMDIAGDWPGLPGIFVAGIFSAALSTVSSVLNTLSGTVYKDFVEGWLPVKPSEKRVSVIMKVLTLALGAGIIALIFVVEKLGSILEVALGLTGVVTGAIFSLFLLGLFVPWAETIGAMCGAVTSITTMSVVCLGALHAKQAGRLYYPPLPTRTDGCSNNSTTVQALHALPSAAPYVAVVADDDLFPLFQLSPFYYIVLGTTLSVVVGATVSAVVHALRPHDPRRRGVDPDLLSPPIARLVRNRRAAKQRKHQQQHVQLYQPVPAQDIKAS